MNTEHIEIDAYAEAFTEAIRQFDIDYGECAGETEWAVRVSLADKLAREKMRKKSKSEGNKFAKNYHRYCECAFPFLFGYFVGTILFALIKLLLYLF